MCGLLQTASRIIMFLIGYHGVFQLDSYKGFHTSLKLILLWVGVSIGQLRSQIISHYFIVAFQEKSPLKLLPLLELSKLGSDFSHFLLL